MRKERYLITIGGEDYTEIERSYTKRQYEIVKDVIDDLQTDREGCSIIKIPNKAEFKNIKKRFTKYSENYTDKKHAFYIFWYNELGKEFDFNTSMYNKLMYALIRNEKL